MKSWWIRAPIILVCLLMVSFTVVFGKVIYAASGMPEFALILQAALDAFGDLLDWLLEILKLIW